MKTFQNSNESSFQLEEAKSILDSCTEEAQPERSTKQYLDQFNKRHVAVSMDFERLQHNFSQYKEQFVVDEIEEEFARKYKKDAKFMHYNEVV